MAITFTSLGEGYLIGQNDAFRGGFEFSGFEVPEGSSYYMYKVSIAGYDTNGVDVIAYESPYYVFQGFADEVEVLKGSLFEKLTDWRDWIDSLNIAPLTFEVKIRVYLKIGPIYNLKETKTQEVEVKCGSTLYPVLSDGCISVAPYNADSVGSMFTVYANSLSKVDGTLDMSLVTTKYSATISKFEMTVDGSTYASENAQVRSALLKNYGTLPVTFKVYDSRGLSASYSTEIVVNEYSAPSISNIKVYRSDSQHTESEEGIYISVRASANISSVAGQNAYKMTAQYAIQNEEYNAPVNMVNGERYLLADGRILPNYGYSVLITLTDTTGNKVTATRILPVGVATYDAIDGGNGFAFGRRANKEGFLDNAWNFHSDGYIETDSDVKAKGRVQADGDVSGANGVFSGNVECTDVNASGNVVAQGDISGANANFSKNLAVGGASTATDDEPKSEFYNPAHFYAGIGDFGGSVQGGLVTRNSPSVAAQSYKSHTVTFPIPFKEVPVVTCTLYSWSTSYYMGGFSVAVVGSSVTKTGFTVNCYNSTSSARDFHLAWMAIGKM